MIKTSVASTVKSKTANAGERYEPASIISNEQPIIFDALQITSPENRSKCEPGDNSPTLNSGGKMTVAYRIGSFESNSMKSSNPHSGIYETDVSKTLDTMGNSPDCNQGGDMILQNRIIRRITPLEAERLQGFPDGHTNIIYKGKPATDSVRYKAIGNSMAVNVMSWIGQRIQLVDSIV